MTVKTKRKPRRREFPSRACAFLTNEPVRFHRVRLEEGADDDVVDDEKPARHSFEMVINTGRIMSHPFWGRFAVDLEGVETPLKRVPTLLDHDQTKRVGYSDPESFEITDRGLETSGELLARNADAQQMISDNEDGFPFQASPFLEPTLLEEVPDGVAVEVNGYEFAGPGTIFRKSRVLENSFVAVGVDDDTFAATFAGKLSAPLITEPEMKKSKKKATKKTATAKKATKFAADTELEDQVDEDQVDDETEVDTEAGEEAGEVEAQEGEDAPSADPAKLERDRASTILEVSSPEQADLARELIADGVPLVTALKRLQKDSKERLEGHRAALGAPDDEDALGGGNVPASSSSSSGDDDDNLGDTELRQQWDKSSALRKEFANDFDTFKAYSLANKAGRVNIFSRQRIA